MHDGTSPCASALSPRFSLIQQDEVNVLVPPVVIEELDRK